MFSPITTEPPTEQQLAEIRARREAITDTPWGSYRDLGGEYTVEAEAKVTLDEGFSSTGLVARVLGDTDEQRYRRADFISQAPYDIDRLHNEIDRLRAEMGRWRAQRNQLAQANEALHTRVEEARSGWLAAQNDVRTAEREIDRLRARVAELEQAHRQIRAIHTDSPMGPCPVCIDADALTDGGDGTVPYPCPTARAAGAQDADPPNLGGVLAALAENTLPNSAEGGAR
ncbi:hypothetical protein [Streptomyces cacaoi]|uniref:hypothetical protein n=1 Tax=Streptomyces cacaoi TaxID=1898 RepID=UPI003747DD36